MGEPKHADDKGDKGSTLVAGEEAHAVENQPAKKPEAPEPLTNEDHATLVAGEETHQIERGGKKPD